MELTKSRVTEAHCHSSDFPFPANLSGGFRTFASNFALVPAVTHLVKQNMITDDIAFDASLN